MRAADPTRIPENHPVHEMFRSLTYRSMSKVGLHERDLHRYLASMLVRFVHIEDLYRIRDENGIPVKYLVDMIVRAEDSAPPASGDAFRHVGDYALFMLGFYPESLSGRRKLVGPDYYAEQGRRSYLRAADILQGSPTAPLLRKLADHFETAGLALNLVRQYTHDPFYQYMLRQFGISS